MKKIFLIAVSALIFSTSYSQTAAELNVLANEKLEAKEFQYAMVLIDKAISADSKNQWYYLTKADIEFHLSGPASALRIIEKAILIDKKNAEPYNRAGSYYSSAGKADSAIMMYDNSVRFAANDTIKYMYITNRAEAKAGKRDFEGSVKDLEMALAFDPSNIGALNNLAPSYRELGMTDKCISTLKKIIALDTLFIGSYVNLGFVYAQIDSLDLALAYFNKALQIDPDEALIYNNRGNIYYKKGDYSSALKDINKSIKIYPTNSYAYRNLALVYIAMNKMDEACNVLAYARDYGFEQRYGTEVSELLAKHCKN